MSVRSGHKMKEECSRLRMFVLIRSRDVIMNCTCGHKMKEACNR